MIFALYNPKGGVGKTASAVNLAYAAIRDGGSALLWDLDPQGAASFYFRIKTTAADDDRKLEKKKHLRARIRATDFDGLDLVPANFAYRHLDLALDATKRPRERLRALLDPLQGDYDHVFLDCPPSISLASESLFAAADVLLVPTIPTPLSLRTLEQLGTFLTQPGLVEPGLAPRVWPFFCMVDRRKKLHRTVCDEGARARFDLLATRIPYASEIEQMGLERRPVLASAPGRPAGRAYLELWREIGERLVS